VLETIALVFPCITLLPLLTVFTRFLQCFFQFPRIVRLVSLYLISYYFPRLLTHVVSLTFDIATITIVSGLTVGANAFMALEETRLQIGLFGVHLSIGENISS
jgi:hypothetical protein